MFEDATFDSRSVERSQAPRWMLLTLAVNLGVVAALIVLPLLYPASLPSQLLSRALYVPAAPAAAAHPTVARPASSASAPSVRNLYTIPTQVPILTSRDPIGAAPAPLNFDSGGGAAGGDVAGGDTSRLFEPAQRPIVQKDQPKAITVTSKVLEGMLISKTTPVYPAIARSTHTSGVVVLAATISKEGAIVNLHVMSGNALLTAAALDAVKTWHYRPYLLNGQPVDVETTINVVFSMAGR